MTAKTRFTAPEALVISGKACCALATPKAENAMQKNTCNPADQSHPLKSDCVYICGYMLKTAILSEAKLASHLSVSQWQRLE